ncbi:MAG: threonine dehydratase [Gammaproteobacteria bacterium]
MLDQSPVAPVRTRTSLADFPVNMEQVYRAHELIRASLPDTPTVSHPLLSERMGCETFVKLENTHSIGSFKIRGGLFLLANMAESDRRRGLVTATRGNHGQSIARAAGLYNARCTIFVPRGNNAHKNAAMTALGADVIEQGHDFDEAWEVAETFATQTGARLVHPAREPDLIAGVATAAVEMIEQAGDPLDAVFVPVGGGSIATGTGLVFRALSPKTRVYGVQAENAPAMHHAWQTGEERPFAVTDTIADGLAVRVPVDFTLNVMRELLAGMLLVSEEEIQDAIRCYADTIHQMAEGGAAAALAGAMKLRSELRGKRVGIVLTGGNIETETLLHALSGRQPMHIPQAMPMYPIDDLSYGY